MSEVPLEGIVSFAAPGKVTMNCQSFEPSSTVDRIKIIAMQVAT